MEKVEELLQHPESEIRTKASSLMSRWSGSQYQDLLPGEPPLKRVKLSVQEEATPKKSVSWASDDSLVQVRTFKKSDSIAVCCRVDVANILGKESCISGGGQTREPTLANVKEI